MPEPIQTAISGDCHTGLQSGVNEAGLRAEIAFWKEMLETCSKDTPAESRERMGFALALAETRLQALFDEYSPRYSTGECPPNVFYLDRSRR